MILAMNTPVMPHFVLLSSLSSLLSYLGAGGRELSG